MAGSTSTILVVASSFLIYKLFLHSILLVSGHLYDYYPNHQQSYYPQLYNQPQPQPQQGFGGQGGQSGFNYNLGNNFYQPPIPPPPIPNLLATFQLPRQVRIPGRIEININGATAEILCEFPRYLILIQKLYWHHRYDDPYGTYYDTNQNFAPRIQIQNEGKHKSILRIQGFNEDDFGHWRCLSSAILPEDLEYYGNYGIPPTPPQNNLNFFGRRKKRSYYPHHNAISTPPPPIKSLFAPFYRPSYGLFGVFLEIKFGGGPPGGQIQLGPGQGGQGGGGGGSSQQLVRLASIKNSNSTNNV